MCVRVSCTTFQRGHLTSPKEKYNFILIESFIVYINYDDVYIYSCEVSSLNVVILISDLGLVFPLDGINTVLAIATFFKKSLCYLP